MAQAGYTPISLYYSTTASATPTAGNLVAGELALNTLDEKLYFKNSAGTVKLLASVAGSSNVSSITFGTTGLTPSTATTGAVTVAGTLAIANGGTGSTSTTYCSLTTNITGTLPVANGGTGITVFGTGVASALGQNVSGTGSIALTTSAVFTTPNLGTPSAVTLTNATGLPLSTGVTGTLGATNGGTAQSTYTTGDTLYASASNTLSKLTIGSTNQVLTVSGGIPTWATPASGGVTTITFGTTGLTPSTATSGAVTVAGTLAVANGGTGTTSTTFTNLTTNVTGTLPVANGGTGRATNTAYAVVCGGTTTGGVEQSIASVGTTGQVLTSNGASALPTFQTPSAGAAFPSGTRMSFQQTSAPTGWTKDTTAAINDSMLRLVTGSATSGGTTAFSTWNAVTATGATTLSISQIPSHDHPYGNQFAEAPASPDAANYNYYTSTPSAPSTVPTTTRVAPQGGGSSHTHSLTRSLKYYDFIIATAN